MIIRTRITNPGIAERLEKDISCFESYGFTFQRDNEDGSGVFTSSSSAATAASQLISRPHNNDAAAAAAASLYINVQDVTLVNSIGPFLRTLVRLCVDPIDPRSLQAIVVIENNNNNNNNNRRKMKDDDDDASSRSLAHAIHMLIRNSMGAALFLNLHIVLPTGISRDAVLKRMKQNDDGCYEYPSVILRDSVDVNNIFDDETTLHRRREPFEIDLGLVQESKGAPPMVTKPLNLQSLKGFNPSIHLISLNVTTRMCTVRLTPLLYHLSQKLLLSSSSNDNETPSPSTPSSVISSSTTEKQTNHPFILVCLEKISNLYRVLMLCRDYGGVQLIGQQLVVVCKDESSVQRFEEEAKNFISKNFLKKQKQQVDDKSSSSSCFPRVVLIEQARDLIVQDIQTSSSSEFSNIVGFDLDQNAKTLSDGNSDANNLLHSAGAVILGYESDGIPITLNEVVSQYVQIQSRTSINIVAAFSIALHVISNN